MTDRDLELLDGYLDNALSSDELREVEDRLESDVLFIGELARLRADRELRGQVWRSMQPTEASVQTVMENIDAALERRDAWSWRLRNLRFAGAAAALILVGFATGWIGRHPGQLPAPGSNAAANLTDSGKSGISRQGFAVALKDETGRVVAVQYFDTREKAKTFEEQLNKWQDQQLQLQNGNMLLMGDRF
jgi:hypothetical protein